MKKRLLLAMPVIASFIIFFGCVFNVYAAGDTTPPVIKWIKIVNPEVAKPGIIYFDINIIEDGIGVNSATVVVQSESGAQYKSSVSNLSLFTGTHRLSVAIPSTAPVGKYELVSVELKDYSQNECTAGLLLGVSDPETGELYSAFSYTMIIVPQREAIPRFFFNVTDEFNTSFDTSASNPNLVSLVRGLNEGQYGKIYVDKKSNGVIPKTIFSSIEGKSVGLVIYDEKTQWIFNGKTITTPKDINVITSFTTETGKVYSNNRNIVIIKFADNGVLPGKARFRMKSDYLYSLNNIKDTLKLYSLSADGNTVTEESNPNFDLVFDGTDKWCYFDITHNSSLVVSSGSLHNKAVVKGQTEICDLPAVKISKPKAAKKAVTVKWKKLKKSKLKKIKGVEIQISTDSGFKNIVKTTTASKKKTSKKIKGLKSKKKYWIRIRAYKNAADGKHVSDWKTKTVKIK